MKYTVVIVTYNRLELLKECVNCVQNQKTAFSDIVIVNNASTDETKAWLDNQKIDNLHLIHETTNGGGAKGFCDGVEYVHQNIKSDWILLIDDDAMLQPNYLTEINNAIHEHEDCLAFSGSVKTDGVIDFTHRKRLHRGVNFDISPVPESDYSLPFFEYDLSSFCGLIFSSKLIDIVGYPKADFFIWYDDSEYSLRLRKLTKIINVNSTFINHKTKIGIPSKVLNWKGYYGIRNSGYVIKTYGSILEYSTFFMRVKIAMYKNLIISRFSHDAAYKYNYELYRDALNDVSNNKLGYNEKYHA